MPWMHRQGWQPPSSLHAPQARVAAVHRPLYHQPDGPAQQQPRPGLAALHAKWQIRAHGCACCACCVRKCFPAEGSEWARFTLHQARHFFHPAPASPIPSPHLPRPCAAVTMDSRLLLWDPASRKIKKTYTGHLNRSSCLQVGAGPAVGAGAGRVEGGVCLALPRAPPWPPNIPPVQACWVVHDCLHDPPTKFVACGSEDHHVYLWDLNTRKASTRPSRCCCCCSLPSPACPEPARVHASHHTKRAGRGRLGAARGVPGAACRWPGSIGHRRSSIPGLCQPPHRPAPWLQVAGILRGRPSPDAPGGGHCATVLVVDAAQKVGCMLIASGGHTGDGTLKIWQHERMPAAGTAAANGASEAADSTVPMDAL